MATIAENLQTLVNNKAAIKAALEKKEKNPSDVLGSYAELIEELDNEEQVSYVLTNADGTQKVYAQLSSKESVTLTAKANDIRLNTSAITNDGYTEGTKDIPAYFSMYGKKIVYENEEATLTNHETDYKNLMVTITPFNSSLDESVEVTYASIDDSMYEAKSTTKISDITVDLDTETIHFGVTVTELSVLRYFVVREEV